MQKLSHFLAKTTENKKSQKKKTQLSHRLRGVHGEKLEGGPQ